MHVRELFDLTGRTALVTGGGRGLGRMLALGLAEAGCRVLIASRKRENCEEVAGEIRARGGEALVRAADLARAEDALALGEWACGEAGGVDRNDPDCFLCVLRLRVGSLNRRPQNLAGGPDSGRPRADIVLAPRPVCFHFRRGSPRFDWHEEV